MTIKDALSFGAKQLKQTGSAALDASVLLCEAIKKPKEFIYTYPEKKLTAKQEKKYKSFIARRRKREPLAYITGFKEFYGFEFLVSPAVLIPRPETETLINAVLETVGHPVSYRYPQIIDVGTGSGAIAITLKKSMPKARVFASDISPKSLNLAKNNARRLNAKIIFKRGDLFKPFFKHPSSISPSKEGEMPERQRGCNLIITANLPYLSRAEWRKTAPEVKKHEPCGALVGGKTGTEIYEKLFLEIATLPPSHSPTHLFIEIGHNQKTAITKLLQKILHTKKIETFKDISGKWRTVHAVLTKKLLKG